MPRRQRIVLLALAVLVAAVAVVVAGTGGSDDDGVIDTRTAAPTATGAASTPAVPGAAARPAEPAIVIRGGRPAGGVQRLRYRKGGDIVFLVRSDTAGEIHLHGYDIAKDVDAGGTVRFDVPAKIDGRFEVELEATETPLATVEVVP